VALALGDAPPGSVGPLTYRLTLAAAVGVLLKTLAVTEFPTLGDFPNHLARGYILAHVVDHPILARVYEINWSTIPNLEPDVLIVALQSAMPIYAAGRVVWPWPCCFRSRPYGFVRATGILLDKI
jgi:hypothetical protein